MNIIKTPMKKLILAGLMASSTISFSQGIIQQTLSTPDDSLVTCGSHQLMDHIDKSAPGFMKAQNQMLREIQATDHSQKKSSGTVLQIPVVFHVVYNDTAANLHDTVIQNQLRVLNENFRRQNADTIDTRAPFKPIVGDSEIEFVLATKDPKGNPTSGITRTYSNVKYFGGILPYDQSQTQQIQAWVNDSLFYNFFRLTQDSLNGKSGWDSDHYVNVWIGDLRIFEPKVNNFEELVYFGLSTPPANHPNWPVDIYTALDGFHEGILLHYPVVGGNNPNFFPAPYQSYNASVKTGKMLVHEAGHYLGLRHIWGDGGCNVDDFIKDTPRSNKASTYNCNHVANTCVDTIQGADLPNMVENFMDYSSGHCQNSFTLGQINVMRTVIQNYRPNLLHNSVVEFTPKQDINFYPNPTSGHLTIEFESIKHSVSVKVMSISGQLLSTTEFSSTSKVNLSLNQQPGLYIIQVETDNEVTSIKILKQ